MRVHGGLGKAKKPKKLTKKNLKESLAVMSTTRVKLANGSIIDFDNYAGDETEFVGCDEK